MAKKYINADCGKDVHVQQIDIDLMRSEHELVNIGTQWEVALSSPKRRFLNWFRNQKVIDRDVFLSVRNLNVESHLEVDKQELLSVALEGKKLPLVEKSMVDIHIDAPKKWFSLFFNPGAVIDYSLPQGREDKIFLITFNLALRDDLDKEICKQTVRLNIRINRVSVAPQVFFLMNKASMTYKSSLGIEQVGVLKISNPAVKQYVPCLSGKFKLSIKCGGVNVPQRKMWLDYQSVKRGKVRSVSEDGLYFELEDMPTSLMDKARSVIEIPVMANIHEIGNPAENGKAEFVLRGLATYHNAPESHKEETKKIADATFILEQNRQQPGLVLTLTDPTTGRTFELTENAKVEVGRVSFLPGQNLKLPVPISFANPATEGPRGAGVVIGNLSYKVRFAPHVEAIYATRRDSAETLVQLDADQNFCLPNSQASHRQIRVIFDGDRVRELYCKRSAGRDYNVNVIVDLAFDYLLDAEGRADIDPVWAGHHVQQFKTTLVIPVYQQPDPNWLAVDFGTSAIVSQYGETMIDLHEQKNALNDNSDDDTYEVGMPFLSSNIVLRPVAGDVSNLMTDHTEAVDFKQLAVWLSPTSVSEQANITSVIPCLKLIVGYDLLPNIENYRNYRYAFHEDGQTKTSQPLVIREEGIYGEIETYPTPLAKVDTVFSEVYKELFTFFVSPSVKDAARKVNQLILTIPNTYTPTHISRIRQIVKTALAGVNIRTVNFVSESDAVACYYQSHWAEINEKTNRTQAMKEELRDCENVLIYDMGAGTLDVTLFTRTKVGDKVVVKVVGRIGIAKAGNYLDCLLAHILAEHIKSLRPFALPENIDQPDRVKAAFALKAIIKNEIKPKLSGNEVHYILKRNMGLGLKDDVEFNLKEHFLSHPLFTGYVDSVTTEFLQNFSTCTVENSF